MIRHHHSLFGEGIDVGIYGALTVAAFFLLIDLLAGRPFYTPNVLGQVIIFGREQPDTERLVFAAMVVYTVVHFVVFGVFGVIVTQLVHLTVREPVFLFPLMMLFVVFELFFYGASYMFFNELLELLPWWSILAANLLAAGMMGGYLWVKHPSLRRGLKRHPLGV